jgi:L-asparaginase II
MLDPNWGYQIADTLCLANLTRAGIVESRHMGLAALTGPDGKLIAQYGNARKLIFPRSAVKMLQAVAVRRAGLVLEGKALAMSSASHQGTKEHQAIVLEILQSAGLGEADLLCPKAMPGNLEARAQQAEPTRLAFNCSGKHAAFLAACVKNSWDTKTYLEPEHPLQQLIVEVTEEYSGEKIPFSTFDGCGAPLHLMSLQALAKSIGKFSATDLEIAAAMKEHAWVVDDHDAIDTMLLEQGMIAKIGAEGVFVVGLESGQGIAIKIADGSLRAAALVAIKILLDNGLLEQKAHKELHSKLELSVFGGQKIIGSLEVAI